MRPSESTLAWYLWDGGFLALGKIEGIVPRHAHHAIQIAIAVEGAVGIKGGVEEPQSCRGVIVRADVAHSFNGQGATGAMLFIDPESAEGSWLRSSLATDITLVPDARLAECVRELRTRLERPLESSETGAVIRQCVQSLCFGAAPARRRDQRVSLVLKTIRDSDDLRMSVESAAATVFLSPRRFTHLFTQQVGLPFRRYMLWRKVARAVLAIGQEGSIAAAARAADFADAAHLTRTFHQMFGLPPSVMTRGEFFQIRSPFELPEH